MNRQEILALLKNRLDDIRRRFGVLRLEVFGSAARDELRTESDVDVLVEFNGPATYQGYMGLKFYLEELIGRPVDLVTTKGLRKELRPYVEREAIRVA